MAHSFTRQLQLSRPTLAEFRGRFERFAIQLVPDGDCLLWSGAKHERGYGRLRWHGRVVSAHRLAWELWTGEAPPLHHVVAHRCGRPECCNPAHLELSDSKDNAADQRGILTARTKPKTQAEADAVLARLDGLIERAEGQTARLRRRKASVLAKRSYLPPDNDTRHGDERT